MDKIISTQLSESHIHFMIDNRYLGMLVFEKGELSDFRAIIRKNKLELNGQTLRKTLEVCVYELLNQYLPEAAYIDRKDVQETKNRIVNSNSEVIDRAERAILEEKVLLR